MKRLFFVVGPESSGTRLTTRILCESGCFGDYDHYQRLDPLIKGEVFSLKEITGEVENIVIRRSVPHGDEFPDFSNIVDIFYDDFEIYYIVTVRQLYPLCKSKVNNNGKNSIEDSLQAYKEEMFYIIKNLDLWRNILFFSTSFLFKFPNLALNDLKLWTGLDIPFEKVKEFIYDADINHYKENE